MINRLQIPEIILYNVVSTILKTIRQDLLETKEEETIFYKLFYGTKFDDLNLDFYENAKELFLRDKAHNRFLEARMFFNADRANIPTIHLNLPSESDIGGGIGVDEGYKGNNYNPIENTISQNHTRTFNTVYNIIITSDNSDEVLIIYHALRAFMISMLDIIDLNGLKNPKLGGADLQFNPEIVPPHIFVRNISLNCFYEITVPSIVKQKIINRITIQSKGIIDSNQPVNIDQNSVNKFKNNHFEIVEFKGLNGQSAYEIWLSLGNIGTKIDFINSLKGQNGEESQDYVKKQAYDSPYIYVGYAEKGNLETDSVWIITRVKMDAAGIEIEEEKTATNAKWSDYQNANYN